MNARKLPVGIQSFEKLRTNGYVYVDKTKYIWDLVENGSVYFLSRPRRFGKSLLVSAMEAYFQGKKDLFRGLAIDEFEKSRGDKAWAEYPVMSFYLSGGNYNDPDGLGNVLDMILSGYEEKYGIEAESPDLPVRFSMLIQKIHEKTGKPVVVLVDEYDKPLLETMIVNPEQESRNRQLYKSFFSVLKDRDPCLKFVFFTGVTKFSKVSIFSDLNQLNDISMRDEFSCICGITEDELIKNFGPEISAMTDHLEISREECLSRLMRMYDGYHFSKKSEGVYNPFSLLNAFDSLEMGSYWFDTGTPTFLINKLMDSDFSAEELTDGVDAGEMSLKNYRPEDEDPIPLFYQTGYLTINDFDEEFRIYNLKFPNHEVRYGFLESLAPSVLGRKNSESPVSMRNMVLDLRKGDVGSFIERIRTLLARIPYPEGRAPEYEQEWRNQIFIILELMGQFVVKCEPHTALGRADCIVETAKYVYVMEFKLDRSADEALGQIDKKGYAEAYRSDPRKLIRIGVNFSTEKRNIADWKTA